MLGAVGKIKALEIKRVVREKMKGWGNEYGEAGGAGEVRERKGE